MYEINPTNSVGLVGGGGGAGAGAEGDAERARKAEDALKDMEERYRAQEVELQKVRAKCLPGR